MQFGHLRGSYRARRKLQRIRLSAFPRAIVARRPGVQPVLEIHAASQARERGILTVTEGITGPPAPGLEK